VLDLFIVKAKIKELAGKYNVSGEFPEELNNKVKEIILKAIERAKANGRRTLMGRDL
jgi:histone H3/H4|tara:strand:- start:278 stop:448 length:171 start_codon:yes stop_codon:yes gene_type:complete